MREEAFGTDTICQRGDYWLAKRKGSPNYYVFWYDHRIKRVIRRSTGFQDIDSAKRLLEHLHLTNPASLREVEPTLGLLLSHYWEVHASKLTDPTPNAAALKHWRGYFDQDTPVQDITPTTIRQFWEHLRQKGQSEGSISRITSIGRAALNRAYSEGLLPRASKIPDNQTELDRMEVEPMGRALSTSEMSILYNAPKPPCLHKLLMIMGTTLCRTGAALDLSPAQIDWEHELVHLNPKGRRQTKKRRPIVPLTKTLRKTLEHDTGARYVSKDGETPANIYSDWRRLVLSTGLTEPERVKPYSLRHTMARALRARRISSEEISVFLGHRPHGVTWTTVRYAPYDPDFLANAAQAIDSYFVALLPT